MKIDDVKTWLISIPRRRPHNMVNYGQTESRYVLIQIVAEGAIGFGEASTVAHWSGHHGRHYGEAPEICQAIIRDLFTPVLLGQDPVQIEQIRQQLDAVVAGYPYAKAAVEMALFDLKGRVLGLPVYELLGGAVRKRIPVMHSVGLMETDRAVEEAARATADGMRYIKVKAGKDHRHDVATIVAVSEAMAGTADVLVDFNGGYADIGTTLRVMSTLDAVNVLAAEEPGRGAAALQHIRSKSRTPVIADESVWSAFDVIDLWSRDAVDGVSLYIFKAGGMRQALAAASAANALNLSLNVNGSGELGVGNAANLHLAASAPGVRTGSVLPLSAPAGLEQTAVGGRSYVDDIISAPFGFIDGDLLVPEAPGLGVDVDMEKVEYYATS